MVLSFLVDKFWSLANRSCVNQQDARATKILTEGNPKIKPNGLNYPGAPFKVWWLRTLPPMEQMPCNVSVTVNLLLSVTGDVAVSLGNDLYFPCLKTVIDTYAVNSLYCRTLFYQPYPNRTIDRPLLEHLRKYTKPGSVATEKGISLSRIVQWRVIRRQNKDN